jgi:hypothetical protein
VAAAYSLGEETRPGFWHRHGPARRLLRRVNPLLWWRRAAAAAAAVRFIRQAAPTDNPAAYQRIDMLPVGPSTCPVPEQLHHQIELRPGRLYLGVSDQRECRN